MKKSELIKIVREAIKKEIKTSLRKVIEEEITKVMKNLLVEHNKEKKDPTSINEAKKQVRQGLDLQKQILTKDSILNDILNQTKSSMNPEEKLNFGNDNQTNSVLENNNIPNIVQKALTKDYSKLMEAVDKHKAGTGGFRP